MFILEFLWKLVPYKIAPFVLPQFTMNVNTLKPAPSLRHVKNSHKQVKFYSLCHSADEIQRTCYHAWLLPFIYHKIHALRLTGDSKLPCSRCDGECEWFSLYVRWRPHQGESCLLLNDSSAPAPPRPPIEKRVRMMEGWMTYTEEIYNTNNDRGCLGFWTVTLQILKQGN